MIDPESSVRFFKKLETSKIKDPNQMTLITLPLETLYDFGWKLVYKDRSNVFFKRHII